MKTERLKILVCAYACEPGKGSEPEVGWNWVKLIARFAETWVITRTNNKEVIEKELEKHPFSHLHFIYIDLPKWMRFWKKGPRGVRTYYYLWQLIAFKEAFRFHKKIGFDLAHQVTFVNDWLPSFISLLPLPFVWGPIGSNLPLPREFLPHLRSLFLEKTRLLIQNLFRICDPFFYMTLFKAKKIIMIEPCLSKRYPFTLVSPNKFIFQPAIGIDSFSPLKSIGNKRTNLTIVSVGRLTYIKGFHLSLKAFARVCKRIPDIELKIIGEGSEQKNLEALAFKEGIRSKVIFLGNLKRERVYKELKSSDIFLFPSFEGGGIVVLEAMASGLPVICLDYGGPGKMVSKECGIKIKLTALEQTINDLAEAILRLAKDSKLRKKMGDMARKRVEEFYTWDKKGEFIQKVYQAVLAHESAPCS